MKQLKSEELSKLSETELVKRLNDLRSELSKMRSSAARGTLKKELGEIKSVRKNIARVLTAVNTKASAPKEKKTIKESKSEENEEKPSSEKKE